MCDFEGASLRKGIVVNATDHAGEFVRLTVAEARTIGQYIDAERNKFVDAQVCAIEAVRASWTGNGTLGEIKVATQPPGPLQARFQPGLILDFPRVFVEDSVFGTLGVRSCITVCALDARSKVWARCVTSRPVEAMDQDALNRFHDLAGQLCDVVNAATREHYQACFALDRFTKAPKLRTHGRINLMLVDCVGEKFQASLLRQFEEISWGDEKPSSINDWEVSKALRGVTGIDGAPPSTQDASQVEDAFHLMPDASFYPFMSSMGAQSLLVAAAAEDTASLYGIVGSAKSRIDDKPYPASVGLSAELANHLGGVY